MFMRSLVRPILTVILLSAFACGVPAYDSPQNAAVDLGDTFWRLIRFRASDGQTLAPGDPTKYTIAFEAGGGVSVRIDCNRGHGTWKSAGPDQIQFGPLALTRVMCPTAPLNDRIPKNWERVRSYVLKHDHLFLSVEAEGGTYEFEPTTADGAGTTGSASENQACWERLIPGLPATFVGILPCADCPGIRYQVDLLPDHKFSSRMTYAERNTRLDDSGSWQFANDGKTLLLQDAHGAREKFAPRHSDTLRKLDADGREIESKLNLDLKRASSFSPLVSHSGANGEASLDNTHWKADTPGRDARCGGFRPAGTSADSELDG